MKKIEKVLFNRQQKDKQELINVIEDILKEIKDLPDDSVYNYCYMFIKYRRYKGFMIDKFNVDYMDYATILGHLQSDMNLMAVENEFMNE